MTSQIEFEKKVGPQGYRNLFDANKKMEKEVKKSLADAGLATLSEKEKRRAAKLRERLSRIEAELDAADG